MHTNKTEKFRNARFFHFALHGEDEGSRFIRNTIIEGVTGIHVKKIAVVDRIKEPSEIFFNSFVLDEACHMYEIAIQTGNEDLAGYQRISAVGAMLLSEQGNHVSSINDIVPVWQIIFVDTNQKEQNELIQTYTMCNDEGEQDPCAMIKRFYVHLPWIDTIVKEKTITGMNDFEQLCYLLQHNVDDVIRDCKGVMLSTFMKKYEQFLCEENR